MIDPFGRRLLRLGLLPLLLGFNAYGAGRVFVSTAGSDVADCSRGAPCRTFQRGANVVDPGGEVIALDSGGFGSISVGKNVSILAPSGIHAALGAGSGSVISLALPVRLTLRGVSVINTGAATVGINCPPAANGSVLTIDKAVIRGFGVAGVQLTCTSEVFVGDTALRDNAGIGIAAELLAGGAINLSVSRVQFENNTSGLQIGAGVSAAVRDSVATGNSKGFGVFNVRPGTLGSMHVEASTASGNATGYAAEGSGTARLTLSNAAAAFNNVGVLIGGGNAQVLSFGNNAIANNTLDVSGVLTAIPGGLQ